VLLSLILAQHTRIKRSSISSIPNMTQKTIVAVCLGDRRRQLFSLGGRLSVGVVVVVSVYYSWIDFDYMKHTLSLST
jgi:hypothetical protein